MKKKATIVTVAAIVADTTAIIVTIEHEIYTLCAFAVRNNNK
jgi:hypothetical protein